MRIVVVGPGAIGCLFAALLTEAEYDVMLLDKEPQRARLISRQGVLLEERGRTRNVRVPASAAPGDIGPADFVCICVKSFDTRRAVDHALPLVGPRSIVVSVQNGLGNAEDIVRAVGADKVVSAATSQGSTSLGTAHIRHAGAGLTSVASCTSDLRHAAAFARILRRAGIQTEVLHDAVGMIWGKLIVNAAINAVTAIWDVPNGEILSRPALRSTAGSAAREAEAVAQARKIVLPFADAVIEMEKVCLATALNCSSMLQDTRNGRRTEIQALNGAVVREARGVHVPTPANRMLLKKVLELERRKRIRR